MKPLNYRHSMRTMQAALAPAGESIERLYNTSGIAMYIVVKGQAYSCANQPCQGEFPSKALLANYINKRTGITQ